MKFTIDRALEVMKPFAAIFGFIIMLSFFYGYFGQQEYDEEDSFTVTITYECTEVLVAKDEFPNQVYELCLELEGKQNGNNR